VARSEQNVIVGLDIGTSKIACVVAEVSLDGHLDVIGIGRHASNGLKRGVVVNIESTVQAIRLAVEEAELMSGVDIHSVFVGIAGSHIKGQNSHGTVAIKTGEITEEDVKRSIDVAKACAIPGDQQILHILPQEYIIDQQDGIREPVGMSGVRLEARIHMITAAVSSAQNIIKCCKRCDLDVSDMVLEQVASSEAVLSQDEKDIGVVLIDIGGGTTDMAIFIDGAIVHTAVIPIGGDHLTSDLVNCLRTSAREADLLKVKHGSCMVELVPADEQIEVPGVGGRESSPLPRQVMVQYLEARTVELLDYVRIELQRSGYEDLVAAGLVITGGTSLLEGMVELAEQTFDGLPVRRGYPQGVGGLVDVVSSPIYATGVGLLLYGQQHYQQAAVASHVNEDESEGLWHKMRQWFGDTK